MHQPNNTTASTTNEDDYLMSEDESFSDTESESLVPESDLENDTEMMSESDLDSDDDTSKENKKQKKSKTTTTTTTTTTTDDPTTDDQYPPHAPVHTADGVAILVGCLQKLLMVTFKEALDEGADVPNVLSTVLKEAGRRRGEADGPYHARLLALRNEGRRVMNQPPLTTPIPSVTTAFGDVLEVYTVLAVEAMGQLNLKTHLGDAPVADVPQYWNYEASYLSKWKPECWGGVGERHIPNIPDEPKIEEGFLKYAAHLYTLEDPSADVGVLLSQAVAPSSKLFLNIQCKARGDGSQITPDEINKFVRRTTQLRERLAMSKVEGSDFTDGVKKVVGVLLTNKMDYMFDAVANKHEPDYHLVSPRQGYNVLYDLFGTGGVATAVLNALKSNAAPEGVIKGNRDPRKWQSETIEAFKTRAIATYNVLKPIRDAQLAGERENLAQRRASKEAEVKARMLVATQHPAICPASNGLFTFEDAFLSPEDANGVSHFRCQIVAGCGAGKTDLAAQMTVAYADNKNQLPTSSTAPHPRVTVLFVAPLISLAEDGASSLHLYLENVKTESSRKAVCCSGHHSPSAAVAWLQKRHAEPYSVLGVCMDSLDDLLAGMKAKGLRADILFLDEAHKSTGAFVEADPKTGKAKLTTGNSIVRSKTKAFSEYYSLFEMSIALTATPKVHSQNSGLGACEEKEKERNEDSEGDDSEEEDSEEDDSDEDDEDNISSNKDFWGNGFKHCGVATRKIEDVEGDQTVFSSGDEDNEEDDTSSKSTTTTTMKRKRPSTNKPVVSAKKQQKKPKKVTVTAPYDASFFNCQNDARGTYGPVLACLSRERALREGIIVPEDIVYLCDDFERETKSDFADGVLQRVISEWNVALVACGQHPQNDVTKLTDVELRRFRLVAIMLIKIARGHHTHGVLYFNFQRAARGSETLIRALARFFSTKLGDPHGGKGFASFIGMDPGEDLELAAKRLDILKDNVFCMISGNGAVMGRGALQKFKKAPISVITNVHMFKLGVDVPHASLIVFADPMTSPSDIEQAIGRGRRRGFLRVLVRMPDGSFALELQKKTRCEVLIPCTMDIDKTNEDIEAVLSEFEQQERENSGEDIDEEIMMLRREAAEVEKSYAMVRAVAAMATDKIIVDVVRAGLMSCGGASTASKKKKGVCPHTTGTVTFKKAWSVTSGKADVSADGNGGWSFVNGDQFLMDMLKNLTGDSNMEKWVEICTRWKADYPERRTPSQKEKYNDAVHGEVNIGTWVDRRKQEANGNRRSAETQARSRDLLQTKITSAWKLGAEPEWWVITTRTKLLSDDQWMDICARWKADHPGKRTPSQTEKYEDAVHGEVNICTWLYSRKQEANGTKGSAETQARSRELLQTKITSALKLDAEPEWWITTTTKLSNDQWVEIFERWKADNPDTRTPSQEEKYEDAVHGEVNIGSWLNSRKQEANGNRGSADTQARSRELLRTKITFALKLGAEPEWWKTTTTKLSNDQWVEIFERWKADYPGKRTPGGKEKYNDAVHGEVSIGRWLDSRKQEANGNSGSAETQARSQELLRTKITSALKLDARPEWWETTTKLSDDQWVEIFERWKVDHPEKRTPSTKDKYEDAVHGERKIGTWLNTRKREANGKGSAETQARSRELLQTKITSALKLGAEPEWWKITTTLSDDQWVEICTRWKADHPKKRTPSQKEKYNDAVHGEVNIGTWLNSRKQEANGNSGSAGAQVRSRKLLQTKITSALKLDAEPEWWVTGVNN